MTRKGYAMAFDYPVILSKRGERFLASFPDFPGCYGEGSDRLDAMEDARTEGVNCILQELEEGTLSPRGRGSRDADPHPAPRRKLELARVNCLTPMFSILPVGIPRSRRHRYAQWAAA